MKFDDPDRKLDEEYQKNIRFRKTLRYSNQISSKQRHHVQFQKKIRTIKDQSILTSALIPN